MIADDLFAGAGGWDLAAAQLGIHARGVENMKEARATREAAGLTTIHDDVWTFKPDGDAEGLIASPPCQTFSLAGKGTGRTALDAVRSLAPRVSSMPLERLRENATYRTKDERTALVLTPLWFALNHNYRWLAWEQVPTVLPVWEACAEELRQHGWSVWTGLLHAEQYGVPQTRKRAFLLASAPGYGATPAQDLKVQPPNPTHSRYWRGEGPAPELPDWAFNRPSTTIVGSFKPEIVAAPGYRTTISRQNAPDSVRVSVQEAGVLQSFPADFPWQGAKGKQFLQCGNAIPPGLALHALASAAGVSVEERAA